MKIAAYFQVNGIKVFPLVNQPFQKHEIPIGCISISPSTRFGMDYLQEQYVNALMKLLMENDI